MPNASDLLTIIIPSADPRFLPRMIPDLLLKAAGPIEIIVSLDGVDAALPEDPRVIPVRHERLGMRGALNAARAHVRGDWVMKCDEHVMFKQNFDAQLKADYQGGLLIPRRYSLDADAWAIEDNGKGPRDYHSLSNCVWSIRERHDFSMNGLEWAARTRERLNKPEFKIDETLSWQGSFYFMSRDHWDWLGPLQEEGYGSFASEPQEIGLKTQLGGEAIWVTKNTYACHLHKGSRYGRGYRPNRAEIALGHEYSAWYWVTNQWPERKHDFRWLIEKWWPIPTWPIDTLENWDFYYPQGADLSTLKARALERPVTYA